MSCWLRRLLRLTLVLLALFFVGANAWVWSAGWGRLAESPADVPAGSVLVLLGTDEFVGATAARTGTFLPRIEAAATLARSGRVKIVVCSGTPVHARVMAERLRAAGVTCPLVEDPHGLRTLDSVLRAHAHYPRRHVVYVSQGWHAVRALWLADRAGQSAVAYPAAFGEGWRPMFSALRDTLAKPKALLDHAIWGNPLSTSVPAGQGNLSHR